MQMVDSKDLLKAFTMCVLMLNLTAHPLHPKPRCDMKNLVKLTKVNVEKTLQSYIAKNNHNRSWIEHFPELEVPSSTTDDSQLEYKSLQFMVYALNIVLKQQEGLNPNKPVLQHLKESIYRINCLLDCVGGKVSTQDSPTSTPQNMMTDSFAQKRWGRAVLEASHKFLVWLEKLLMLRHTTDSHHLVK
ncbi:hypothetical protein MATL_G00061270 [Megalops atlanticus]|uniref:Uncharacterized protein n=1 Tax=Megalops atlanticus TaxID=7932 RepID=A0A9D3QCM3_MEGAT|nr:hypothetical protein MATL_G00061270 [Megalops atlanticus]